MTPKQRLRDAKGKAKGRDARNPVLERKSAVKKDESDEGTDDLPDEY